MGDSLDNASIEPNTTDEHSTSIVESSVFTQFLSKAVKLLLQEEGEDEIDNALAACFEEKNHLECVRKFLSDPQVPTLFVQRGVIKGMLWSYPSYKVNIRFLCTFVPRHKNLFAICYGTFC